MKRGKKTRLASTATALFATCLGLMPQVDAAPIGAGPLSVLTLSQLGARAATPGIIQPLEIIHVVETLLFKEKPEVEEEKPEGKEAELGEGETTTSVSEDKNKDKKKNKEQEKEKSSTTTTVAGKEKEKEKIKEKENAIKMRSFFEAA